MIDQPLGCCSQRQDIQNPTIELGKKNEARKKNKVRLRELHITPIKNRFSVTIIFLILDNSFPKFENFKL